MVIKDYTKTYLSYDQTFLQDFCKVAEIQQLKSWPDLKYSLRALTDRDHLLPRFQVCKF